MAAGSAGHVPRGAEIANRLQHTVEAPVHVLNRARLVANERPFDLEAFGERDRFRESGGGATMPNVQVVSKRRCFRRWTAVALKRVGSTVVVAREGAT